MERNELWLFLESLTDNERSILNGAIVKAVYNRDIVTLQYEILEMIRVKQGGLK